MTDFEHQLQNFLSNVLPGISGLGVCFFSRHVRGYVVALTSDRLVCILHVVTQLNTSSRLVSNDRRIIIISPDPRIAVKAGLKSLLQFTFSDNDLPMMFVKKEAKCTN